MEFFYRCSQCGTEYEITSRRLLCDRCSAEQTDDVPLRGILEVVLSGSPPEDWTVADLLPVEPKWFPPIPVGNTPLWEPERLRQRNGFPRLFLKDDSCNPTGSLKDRASYLVAAFARREGVERIVVSSTGNAGSSMCGIGAAAGIPVRLYLPASAPPAKLVQSQQYGAEVIRVEGTYDEAFAQSMRFIAEHGGLSRNTGHNPLTIEGKKTVSLEIYRQLGYTVPDYVLVPTGDGVIISGVYKGFEDLVSLGISDRMPTVVAVQAVGSAAISSALRDGAFSAPKAAHTVADSISVEVPSGGYFALDRLKRHGGRAITVTDEAILAAQRDLAANTGLFAEPAAAAGWAGFEAIQDELPKDATVVVLVTGNGLKDIDSARKGLEGA